MLPAEDLCQLDQAQYAWSLLPKIKELVAEFWFAAYWIQLYNVLIRELVGSWGLFAEFWWGLGRVIPAGEGKGATLLWSSRVNSPRLQVRWATLLFLKAFKFLLRVAKCKTLHRSNLSNSILPQRKCVNCDNFTLKLNEIERIGSFWGKIWMVSYPLYMCPTGHKANNQTNTKRWFQHWSIFLLCCSHVKLLLRQATLFTQNCLLYRVFFFTGTPLKS